MAISPPLQKNGASENAFTYGVGRWYLEAAIIGQGAAAPLTLSVQSTVQAPGSIEITSITRTSTGVYVVTLSDSYYSRIYAAGDIDDSANLGAYMTLGNWTNLGVTGAITGPTGFTMYARNAGGTLTDIPLNTIAFFAVAFKKDYSGAAA
jgi:hypothetical protein